MDCVEIYFKQIGRYPLLSKDEETILFKQLKQGDTTAKEVIINSNLRLVVSVSIGLIAIIANVCFCLIVQHGF